MIKTIKWLFKTIIASILAFAISSAVCLIYYNPGIHITNKTGVTDYVWQSNCFASDWTEGVAWNRTDKNGFYNKKTCKDKNMDILVMGSSHMEGTHVFSEQKTSWLLENITNKSTYNIGTSAHGLLTCVKNLETALEVMQPTEYVIIETGTTEFTKEAINDCLSGNMANIPSYDSGLLFHMQKIPYLKLVYAQLKSWDGVKNNDVKTQIVEKNFNEHDPLLSDTYVQLTQKISEICAEHNVQPIIFYHPHLKVNEDGTVTANLNRTYLKAFVSACQANHILFVDMTDDFVNMYNKDYVLPHGFCNTSVGAGHLNQYGLKAIAERLAVIISDNSDSTEENKQ